MKSRPILFSGPMVRAILDGRKTQTRRVVALPRKRGAFVLEDHGDGWWPYQSDDGESSVCNDGCEYPYSCPYGVPGDQLLVRETWARDDEDGALMYRADLGRNADADAWEQGRIEGVPRYRWRPAIHMPRWASRITLEITGVRVERLQEISTYDAWAEGIPGAPPPGVTVDRIDEFVRWSDGVMRDDPKAAYRALWEQINGPGSWDANPWVWVVQFRPFHAAAVSP